MSDGAIASNLLAKTVPIVVAGAVATEGLRVMERTGRRTTTRRTGGKRMHDPRYKLPAGERRFGGKKYTYLMVGNKAESERDAERYRQMGYSVRIVKWNRQYAIYTRREK